MTRVTNTLPAASSGMNLASGGTMISIARFGITAHRTS
jgi:hypothetical protein